jgi:hypothetical protein
MADRLLPFDHELIGHREETAELRECFFFNCSIPEDIRRRETIEQKLAKFHPDLLHFRGLSAGGGYGGTRHDSQFEVFTGHNCFQAAVVCVECLTIWIIYGMR